ncbi:MAG: YicC family protein, partial [Gammaproteobacteria bacterium]|nr:YicC family protein [Gammaproteobacteria bacterium]
MGQLHSMTGFGRIQAQAPDGQLEIEIRSVNHRYLDMQFRLPEGFRSFEQDLRKVISDSIKRGKVDVTVTFNSYQDENHAPQLNMDKAREVIEQLQAIATQMDSPAAVSPMAVLRAPGVLEERPIDVDANLAATTDALQAAVDRLLASRANEGAKVRDMLEERCRDIATIVVDVQKRLPDVLVEIRKRIEQRVESLNAQVDPERLEQELAIIAQKLDVSEELDRLIAHVSEVRSAFNGAQPVGRRLDFLMQELNREANTLGSKSADTETTQSAVDLK